MIRSNLNKMWFASLVIVLLGVNGLSAGEDNAKSSKAGDSKATGGLHPVPVYTLKSPPKTPALDELESRDSVSQYGITWTFDKKVPVGQFINGDWYVVGAVMVKMIDPKPLWADEVKETITKNSVHEDRYVGKLSRNGSTLNPSAKEAKAGFDSRIGDHFYDPSMFTPLPIAMKPGDALVSTISRRNDEVLKTDCGGQHIDPLRTAAVLSCVDKPLPPDAFRPSYCESASSKIYLARDLKRELLLNLPRVAGMPDNLDKYVRGCQRPWIDIAIWGYTAPTENWPHYGQQVVERVGEAALLLLMDYKPEEKEPLLVNMVQVGIDFWGNVRCGRSWPCHGGLNSGRKWPVVQAGLLLGDEDMRSPNTKYPNCLFHEDDQTALCPYFYKGGPVPEGKTFQTSWSGAKVVFTGHSSWLRGGALGKWETGWGPVDLFDPKDWLPAGKMPASEGYRRANTSGAWVGQALAGRLLHAEKYWNHDAFFVYVDRWMTEDDIKIVQGMKDSGRGDSTGKKLGNFGRQGYISSAAWVMTAWEKYRNNIPPDSDGKKTPPADTTWK